MEGFCIIETNKKKQLLLHRLNSTDGSILCCFCPQVLLDTTQMYYYFFHKTPSMALKRVIMILAASLEFEKKHNGEIVERPTDNEEVPHVSMNVHSFIKGNVVPVLFF
jgi:translocation protein SEC63